MVHILGCDHYLQSYDLREFMDEFRTIERELKGRFYSIVEDLIIANRVLLIGEECKPGERTIPQVLARERGCEYVEIDMPVEERKRQGIPDDYEQVGGEIRARAIESRERHMVSRSMQIDVGEGPRLIVCGAEHIAGLRLKFEEIGETVSTRNVVAERWFNPPFKRIFGN